MKQLVLVGAVALFGAQATLSASNTYNFGTIPTSPTPPNNGIGVSLGNENYTAGSWTETNWKGVTLTTNNANTDENIDCVVTLTGTTDVCGDAGPNGAAHIPITAPTETPGGGVTNYLLIDGDPQWGAPVSTDLTGLTSGDEYQISFYQAASEETGEGVQATAYDDSWLAYLLPTSDSAGVYICPQAYCTDNGGTQAAAPSLSTLVFGSLSSGAASEFMADGASSSTAWELESFTFKASATSQVLEFVTNVFSSSDAVLGTGTTFVPPMLALADVTQQQVTPEPGTWTLTILGAGLVLAGSKLRRKLSARR